jgi:hypothetical protein
LFQTKSRNGRAAVNQAKEEISENICQNNEKKLNNKN